MTTPNYTAALALHVSVAIHTLDGMCSITR